MLDTEKTENVNTNDDEEIVIGDDATTKEDNEAEEREKLQKTLKTITENSKERLKNIYAVNDRKKTTKQQTNGTSGKDTTTTASSIKGLQKLQGFSDDSSFDDLV